MKIAVALDKTTSTLIRLESTTPSYLRHHRRAHPDHVVLLVNPTSDLPRVLALYRL